MAYRRELRTLRSDRSHFGSSYRQTSTLTEPLQLSFKDKTLLFFLDSIRRSP